MVTIRTVDKQFLHYVRLYLKGKAYRWSNSEQSYSKKEHLLLNLKELNYDEEVLSNIPDQGQTIDYNLNEAMFLKWLQSFLSEREYQAIFYTIINDYTDVSAGRILGISHSTVSRARKRALTKIQEGLIKGGILSGGSP